MKTLLNTTSSKYAAYKPRWPGDLISNLGCYCPVPDDIDNLDQYYKTQFTNAEKFARDESRAHYGYHTNGQAQAMLYGAASSGYDAFEIAANFPRAILEHSKWIGGEDDTPFMTTQALSRGALDPEITAPDIFEKNDLRNRAATDMAARNMPHLYVIGPNHREDFTRSIKSIYPMMFGSGYEDITFEIHYWGPTLLHDVSHAVRARDAAWSGNAALEKGIALAVQFGLKKPYQIRAGMNYDVTDVQGREISLLDQVWEEARHIVDVATREVTHEGQSYQFRSEKAAALLLTYFMYDDYYQQGHASMEPRAAHPVIKAHYRDDSEKQAFKDLKETMLPFLAQKCDWKTLHKILDHDADLKAYWENTIAPAAEQDLDVSAVTQKVLSYVPRGGFDHEKLRAKAGGEVTYRDAPQNDKTFAMANAPQRPLGLHEDSFSCDFDPKLFNDRNFARLGGTSNPDQSPGTKRYTRDQIYAVQMINGLRDSGARPGKAPRTYLYLDEANSGMRAAYYRHGQDKTVQNPAELSAKFDPLAQTGQTYGAQFGSENAGDLLDRSQSLLCDPDYTDFRENNQIGNIIPHSDIVDSAKEFEGYREALDAEMHGALSAPGNLKAANAVIETVARRLIGMEMNGIVFPGGDLSGRGYRYLVDGALVSMGKVQRPYSGGKYQFEMFIDHDHWKPQELRQAPQKVDLGDLFIHLGLKTKHLLDQKNPPKDPDLIVSMARLTDLVEKVMDPGRMNAFTETHKRLGKSEDAVVIDFNQVDPDFIAFAQHNPGLPDMLDDAGNVKDADTIYRQAENNPAYQAFMNNDLDVAGHLDDPVAKGELIKMIWFYMRAQRIPGLDLPVNGMLLSKGINNFDTHSLRDLPPEYDRAYEMWGNLSRKERNNIYRAHVTHVKGPEMGVR